MVTRIINDFYVTIAVPSVDEILSPNFSYPNYLESEITNSLERLMNGKEASDNLDNENMEDDYLSEIEINRDKLLEEIMIEYEEDYRQGNVGSDIYTEKMKHIAQEYVNLVRKKQQKERIEAFQRGEIDFWQLHFVDLDEISLDRKKKIILAGLRKRLFALERNSGEKVKNAIDTRTIGELGEEYLKRRGRI